MPARQAKSVPENGRILLSERTVIGSGTRRTKNTQRKTSSSHQAAEPKMAPMSTSPTEAGTTGWLTKLPVATKTATAPGKRMGMAADCLKAFQPKRPAPGSSMSKSNPRRRGAAKLLTAR